MKANRTFNVRVRPLDLVLGVPELLADPMFYGERFVLFLPAKFNDGKDRHMRISMSNKERRALGLMLLRGAVPRERQRP